MKLLIVLQVLLATIEICKTDDEPNTTIILNDTQTEMTIQQVSDSSRGSKANEFFDSLRESENDGNDLDFEYDDSQEIIKQDMKDSDKEQEMQEVLLKAMRKPAIRKQIGEVIPILRVMSPAQRLTLAALVSSQIMSQNSLSESNLSEMAAMFAGKNIENPDDRHNITEHLLLPISMDIAKMFKGLGKEMGRNLRQNFYRPQDSFPTESKFRRRLRKPPQRPPVIINRRMDESDYYESSEEVSSKKPVAEALKQPGRDECDYFTKSLCLEVSNYPTEAIILSLRKNEDIAKTFLTDFHIEPNEEMEEQRSQGNARRLQRRQDGQNEIQDLPPEGGFMCPSSIKYARPKRARATSGQWKYIVNAGDYTQTLRLEICQKPKAPCSFITNHLNSQCSQVYNYHRLLTWDENKGLHMDIFKVPSCCSCHIQGYSNFFPPNNDFTFAEKRREPSPESAEFVPDKPERPFNTAGSKREVPKPVPVGIPQTVPVRSPPQFPLNIQEFPRNPVDHLVPPGPPLPLEDESIIISPTEVKFIPQIEHNRRFPLPTEQSRIIHKATERIEINDPPVVPIIPSKQRVKPILPTPPPKPNFKVPHHSVVVSNIPQEPNPKFDSANQVHYLGPLISTPPPPYQKRATPSDGGIFVTPNTKNELPKIKTNPKPPLHYFNPEFNDVKSLPSRVSPLYVTPPKVKEIEIKPPTTPIPQKSEYTATGQKKINYNYHPIIDFFIDSKKRQITYSAPQFRQASNQDWTPVIGH